jgi:hypothetical protein
MENREHKREKNPIPKKRDVMKTKSYFIAITLLIALCGWTGCRKAGCTDIDACNYDPKAKVSDGSCINKGKVTFWQSTAGDGYDIVVTINNTEAIITTQSANVPLCDAAGNATFSLCPGYHTYNADEVFPGVSSWEGSILVDEDACVTVQLE